MNQMQIRQPDEVAGAGLTSSEILSFQGRKECNGIGPLVAQSRTTRVGSVPDKTGSPTRVVGSGSGDPPGGSPDDSRRIIGALITYSWLPEGLLLPIREGKNYIGSGNIASDSSHRECDILVEDAKLSSEHALILCRHGRVEIIDQQSTNGTFINDEMIPVGGAELPNYAKIKTGSTVWTFVKIELEENGQ